MTGSAGELVPVPGLALFFDGVAGKPVFRGDKERERVIAGFFPAMEHIDENGVAHAGNSGEFVARVEAGDSAKEREDRDMVARAADGADGPKAGAAQNRRGESEAELVMGKEKYGVAVATIKAAVLRWTCGAGGSDSSRSSDVRAGLRVG